MFGTFSLERLPRSRGGYVEGVTALIDFAQVSGVQGEESALREALLVDAARVLAIRIRSEKGASEQDLAAGTASVAFALPSRAEGRRILLQDFRLNETPHFPLGLEPEKGPVTHTDSTMDRIERTRILVGSLSRSKLFSTNPMRPATLVL